MFLIWSNEHKAWWKPGSLGYTQNIKEAGVYNEDQTLMIVMNANYFQNLTKEAPNELPVRITDLPLYTQKLITDSWTEGQ